jgi:hypothetical protein
LLLDRTTMADYASVVANHQSVTLTENVVCDTDNPWSMACVWTEKPAGLDHSYQDVSGYTSTPYASAKEYFGYTSASGFTSLSGTSFKNSMGDSIVVRPEAQRCVALIHYSGELFDTYEDWLDNSASAITYFDLYLPGLAYHRSSTAQVGYHFKMSASGGYVRSTAADSPSLGEPYNYLVDEWDNAVGKIFYLKRVVVIDDQEVVVALQAQSNRTWTLPAPRLGYVPSDLPCAPDSGATTILSGTGKDVYVTYALADTGNPAGTGMHCNYYQKLSGVTTPSNVSLKFGSEFHFLNVVYAANRFYALVQVVEGGALPTPDGWTRVELTTQLPGLVYDSYMNSSHLVGHQFILTADMVDNGGIYELPDLIGPQPLETDAGTLPQFGDETVLPGTLQVTRVTNIYEMNFLVNLPATQFTLSQNPTFQSGVNARVTEVALLNQNKEILVTAKAAHPVERIGFQQLAVRLDF